MVLQVSDGYWAVVDYLHRAVFAVHDRTVADDRFLLQPVARFVDEVWIFLLFFTAASNDPSGARVLAF